MYYDTDGVETFVILWSVDPFLDDKNAIGTAVSGLRLRREERRLSRRVALSLLRMDKK